MVNYLNYALERAVKTAAQSTLAIIGADGANLITADWQAGAWIVSGATLASLLTSVINYSRG